jgi:squalene cyclase
VDTPPAPPVAAWDGTHPCRDCGQTCYARAGTIPRCLPCTRGRPADHWGDVAAGDD